MSIPFDHTIRAIYFLSGDGSDWFGGVNANPDGETFHVQYRFRYANPDNPDGLFDDKDEINWFELKATPGPLDRILDMMQKIVDGMQAAGFVPKGGISCKLIRGTMTEAQFLEEWSKLPFVHLRPERVK